MGAGGDYLENLKEGVSGWFRGRRSLICSWLNCIIPYFLYLVIACVPCSLFFISCGSGGTDIDNARYVLSALIQGQAAIISIVITLTLVAVQLSASAYSPRVIDIMKKNPDMWVLLFVYAVSITYGILVLKSLDVMYIEVPVGQGVVSSGILSSSPAVLGFSFEDLVNLACVEGVFSLIALFPYMSNTLSLLKPENIIKSLAGEINEDNILDDNNSPFQPVFDIIHASIGKYDLTTTRVGLSAVESRVKDIIRNKSVETSDADTGAAVKEGENKKEPENDDVGDAESGVDVKQNEDKIENKSLNQNNKISEKVCSYLERCAFAALNNNDEKVISELADTAEDFGSFLAEENLEEATQKVVYVLENVGIKSADKGLEFATGDVAIALGTVGINSAEKNLEKAKNSVIFALKYTGLKSAEMRLEYATMEVTNALGTIGGISADEVLADTISRVSDVLKGIGKKSVENGLKDAMLGVTTALGFVGEISAKNGLIDAAKGAADALGALGIKCAEKGLEDATSNAVHAMLKIITTEKSVEINRILHPILAESLKTIKSLSEPVVLNTLEEFRSEISKLARSKTRLGQFENYYANTCGYPPLDQKTPSPKLKPL